MRLHYTSYENLITFSTVKMSCYYKIQLYRVIAPRKGPAKTCTRSEQALNMKDAEADEILQVPDKEVLFRQFGAHPGQQVVAVCVRGKTGSRE